VDAFTTKAFEGNPAAVVGFDSDEFPEDNVLQAIAAENNLSETAFWRQREGEAGHFDLRWFTPTIEIDLCGHATLACAHVVLHEVEGGKEGMNFHTKSGILPVQALDDGRLQMDFPVYFNASRPDLVQAVGAALGELPQEVLWTEGNRDAIAIFPNALLVQNLSPDLSLLARLQSSALIATAPASPHVSSSAKDSHDFVYRFFGPKIGIPEDPVTGSAQCSLASMWAVKLGKDSLFSRQMSQRGGDLWARYLPPPPGGDGGVTGEARVLVSGRAISVIRGSLLVP